MTQDIRGTALDADEKKRLTKLLEELRIVAKASGQITLHINEGRVAGFTQGLSFR